MSLAKFGRCLVVLPLLPGPALAGGLVLSDGSWASNPALFSPVPLADEAHWTPAALAADGPPFFDVDWSIASTGSFIADSSSGQRYKATVAPSFSLDHTGTRLSFGGTASAQFSKTSTGGGGVNVDDLRLSAKSAYQFDPLARVEGNASLDVTQEDPNAPDVADDVATPPVEVSGSADTTYTQTLGRFNLSLSGNAARDVYGPTTLTDGSSVDNTSQNNTRLGAGLRLGFQLTPVVEVFTDGTVTRTRFDAPSTTLGTSLDGNQYGLRAGIAAKWNETLSASASIGVGMERFDDPTLDDVTATLYSASLSYRPTEALALTGSFDTTIAPPGPNGTGTARIEYAATAGATYLVNDWLDWRGSAGWHSATFAGSGETDEGYSLGVGADYKLNRQAKLTADYGFDHSVQTGSPEDTQTVSFGVTVQR